MPKKCFLCDKPAEYCIKGSSENYCKECAIEQFQDLDYLQKIEETKAIVSKADAAMEEPTDEENSGDDEFKEEEE